MNPLLSHARSLALCALTCTATLSYAADRDIQIRSIDLVNQVAEIHNFGLSPVSIDGWKFCTHDFDEFFKYSGAMIGTVQPGESLFVHFNNDAPAVGSAVNISTIGGFFALPLSTGPYGLAIFTDGPDSFVSFGSTTDMNDHVQWALDPNASVGNMLTRSVQAVSAGLWTDAAATIDVEASTQLIVLTDEGGGVLHSPANYALDPTVCVPDLNNDGFVDSGDISLFVSLFLAGDLAADLNNDGFIDSGDISVFVAAFLAGC